MGVGRRSTYKMDNNGKRISKGARLSVPGARFDGTQVSVLLPFPHPHTPATETAQLLTQRPIKLPPHPDL